MKYREPQVSNGMYSKLERNNQSLECQYIMLKPSHATTNVVLYYIVTTQTIKKLFDERKWNDCLSKINLRESSETWDRCAENLPSSLNYSMYTILHKLNALISSVTTND